MATNLLETFAPLGALRNHKDEAVAVRPIELFFDLVYVFSIIQLSHYLLHHQSWVGALEALTLFAAIWWAWNYSAWSANWIEPNHPAGRVLFLVLMAFALLMAVSVEKAFYDRAGLFVFAYVAMALARGGYMALIFRGDQMGQNYRQLAIWSAFSGLFWIFGALIPDLRLAFWIVAVVVDYAAPYARFWVPGVGGTPMSSWTLKGLHLLERNQLVFLIALGESILLLGGTLVDADLDLATMGAALVGFLIIVTIWWIYFVNGAAASEQAFEAATAHTELARAGLAYAHGVMVCGAIIVAVAIEEIIAHPTDASHAPVVLIAVVGPLAFLSGHVMFCVAVLGRLPVLNFVGGALLVAAGWLVHAQHASNLALGLSVLGALVLVAALSRLEGREVP